MTITDGITTITLSESPDGSVGAEVIAEPITPNNNVVTIGGNPQRQVGNTRYRFQFSKVGVTPADGISLKEFIESGTTAYFTIDLSSYFTNGICGTSNTSFYAIFTSGLTVTDETANYHVVSFTMEECIEV